jgi:hypothetical protein
MGMTDWKVTNYKDPSLSGEIWVYYSNPTFKQIHFSRSVDTPDRDHTATDDGRYYYFGVTKTFNTEMPANIQQELTNGWADYFTVGEEEDTSAA